MISLKGESNHYIAPDLLTEIQNRYGRYNIIYINIVFLVNVFFIRINLKFPSETTVQRFYENFNYGVFWSNQMQTALFMQPHHQNRTLNTEETVQTIQQHIGNEFSQSWRALHNTRAVSGFQNQQIPISISAKIETSYGMRAEWLETNVARYIVDFRNPVVDEALEDMIFSDGDVNDDNGNLTDEDHNNENDELNL